MPVGFSLLYEELYGFHLAAPNRKRSFAAQDDAVCCNGDLPYPIPVVKRDFLNELASEEPSEATQRQ